MRIPVTRWHTNVPPRALLETKVHSNVISSLVFREIDTHTYGFRDQLFPFEWIQLPNLMHGLLTFDPKNRQVVAKGTVNLFTLAFCLVWLSLFIGDIIFALTNEDSSFSLRDPLAALAGFLAYMRIMYLIQASRFSNVASFAARSWERKYVRDIDQTGQGGGADASAARSPKKSFTRSRVCTRRRRFFAEGCSQPP